MSNHPPAHAGSRLVPRGPVSRPPSIHLKDEVIQVAVFLLHGQNTVDLRDELERLTSQYDPAGIGASTFDASGASLSEVRAALSTPPFFGGNRLVVVQSAFMSSTSRRNRGPDAIEVDELAGVIASAPDTTIVVLMNAGKVNKRSIDKFERNIAPQQLQVREFDIPRGKQLVDWVSQRAASHGTQFEPRAIEEMLDHLYPTLWRADSRFQEGSIDPLLIATEIEKLAIASAGGAIDSALVDDLVPRRSGVTAFRLGDETFAGRPDAALQELRRVLENGQPAEAVLGQLAYNLSVLMAASVAAESSPKLAAEMSGFSEAQLGMTVSRKSGWRNRKALRASADSLRRAEWLVKSGRAQNTATLLESTVAEIALHFQP